MKKLWITLSTASLMLFAASGVRAQTEAGNIMMGAQLLNVTGTFQHGSNSLDLGITPQVGFFLVDNFALGGQVILNLKTASHYTDFSYAVGPFARYYFNEINDQNLQFSRRSSFFAEANVNVRGENVKVSGNSTSTNGLGVGIGPGLAYFLTPNLGLETTLKYNIGLGFGNATTVQQVSLNLGIQAYFSRSGAKKIIREEQQNP